MLLALELQLDIYEYTESPGGAAASTDDPFDPLNPSKWWTRRRALIPAYGEEVRGRERDYLFGDRAGEFWLFFLERDLLTPLGRPDTDFLRRWMLREVSTDRCWITDFTPRVYGPPLPHIECYVKFQTPSPVNRD